MTPEELALLRRSCEEQGVPEFVTDPATIQKVATLLRADRADRLAREAQARRARAGGAKRVRG